MCQFRYVIFIVNPQWFTLFSILILFYFRCWINLIPRIQYTKPVYVIWVLKTSSEYMCTQNQFRVHVYTKPVYSTCVHKNTFIIIILYHAILSKFCQCDHLHNSEYIILFCVPSLCSPSCNAFLSSVSVIILTMLKVKYLYCLFDNLLNACLSSISVITYRMFHM